MLRTISCFAAESSPAIINNSKILRHLSGKNWVEALKNIKKIDVTFGNIVRNNNNNDDNNIHIINTFTNELNNNNQDNLLYDYYNWCISQKNYINKDNLLIWFNKLLNSKNPNDHELLAKFFEKFILYTGESQIIKKPVINMDNQLCESLIKVFENDQNIKMYAKCVAYYVSKLRQHKNSSNIRKIEELRFESKITKLNMYIDKLGVERILLNGMFYKFRIVYNKKIKLSHLNHFIEKLVEHLKDKNCLTIEKLVLYIELMHGLHIQQFKETYSKNLNPDIQMARIYRSCIMKSENPDTMIIDEYTKLIANSAKSHMKECIPGKLTLKQRFATNDKQDQIKFHHLSLSIILNVLNRIQEQNKTDKLNLLIPEMGIMIFTLMMDKRGVRPSPACFDNIIELVTNSSNKDYKQILDTLVSARQRMYPKVAPTSIYV